MIITLDTGTTNTRLRLFDGNQLMNMEKCKIGVRSTTQTGSNQRLKEAISDGIEKLLARNGCTAADIETIVASGMIGSELGLYVLPHIFAPAGISELAENCKEVLLPEVSEIPFIFLPGVKNFVKEWTLDEIGAIDVMRGEETEFIGIQKLCGLQKPMLAVLPGSHTKLIVSDGVKIQSCHTSITGEFIGAIAENTILKNALPAFLYGEMDLDYLRRGCRYGMKNGVNQALFRLRMMQMFFDCTDAQRVGFFFGVVLAGDVQMICAHDKGQDIVIGGPEPLRSALAELLEEYCAGPIRKLTDDEVERCVSVGALAIVQARSGNQK